MAAGNDAERDGLERREAQLASCQEPGGPCRRVRLPRTCHRRRCVAQAAAPAAVSPAPPAPRSNSTARQALFEIPDLVRQGGLVSPRGAWPTR